jgi:hypothetical protein
MPKTLYMVVEHFKNNDAVSVYRRFREHGRMAPDGLTYVSSWVDDKYQRCYQLMESTIAAYSTGGSRTGLIWSNSRSIQSCLRRKPQRRSRRSCRSELGGWPAGFAVG